MDQSVVSSYAKKQGFAGAILIGKWNQMLVYEAVPKDFSMKYEYIPTLFLVSEENVRIASDDEAMAFLDSSD